MARKRRKQGYWTRNVVQDSRAPELYSERAIWGFCFLASAAFGAVLFSMNLTRLGKSKYVPPVVVFGVLWPVLGMHLLTDSPKASALYLWNVIGGGVFHFFIWPRLIGRDLKYRTPPIWIPLVVAAVVGGIFVATVIASP